MTTITTMTMTCDHMHYHSRDHDHDSEHDRDHDGTRTMTMAGAAGGAPTTIGKVLGEVGKQWGVRVLRAVGMRWLSSTVSGCVG